MCGSLILYRGRKQTPICPTNVILVCLTWKEQPSHFGLLFKIYLYFKIYFIDYAVTVVPFPPFILPALRTPCALVCASLGPTSLGFSELPGLPGSVFPLPDWGSSPSIVVQISFQFLALPPLLWHPYDSDVGMFLK